MSRFRARLAVILLILLIWMIFGRWGLFSCQMVPAGCAAP